jgi:glycosyltransferase involved in cell wall biosynthesis
MKILCVHQGAELYGSDRSFALSVKTLRDKYPESTLTVIIPKKGDLISLLEPFVNEIIIQDVGAIQRSDLSHPLLTLKKLCVSSYHAWIKMKEYDVIYMNTIVVFAFMMASIFSRKVIVQHIREVPGKNEALIFSALLRINSSYLIFNSNYTKKSYMFLNKNKINVVLNGVEALDFEKTSTSKNFFNILLIGRVHVNKGQLLAIEAIKLLLDTYPMIRLRIVGSPVDGQICQLDNLLKAIKSNQLENIVEHISFQSDTKEHFLWSTISIVPSILPESFGRVAIESMSLGRPVIASELGGLVEILQDDFGGYLFKVGDENDLALKISLLIDDKELLKKKSAEAKLCFEKKFSESIYMNNFKNTFDKILKQNNL